MLLQPFIQITTADVRLTSDHLDLARPGVDFDRCRGELGGARRPD
jgi:hypothetical protein